MNVRKKQEQTNILNGIVLQNCFYFYVIMSPENGSLLGGGHPGSGRATFVSF